MNNTTQSQLSLNANNELSSGDTPILSIPPDCKRIFVTAKLKPSNGDPRLQPTGFPDVGPVLYPDPSGQHGNICIIDSEAKAANYLEEVCFENKYEGTLKSELAGLPYIKVSENGVFKTSSTIDGHRFASEYVMKAKAIFDSSARQTLVEHVKGQLEAGGPGDIPAANVPRIFTVTMLLDPLSLVHGFQISLKNLLTFVGLRSARALCGSVLGFGTERLSVPGVRIDPIGTGDARQAIFQKERITAKTVEARFTIDVGLIRSFPLALGLPLHEQVADPTALNTARQNLLLAISLWKIASLLKKFADGERLRTDCDLTLDGDPSFKLGPGGNECPFLFSQIAGASLTNMIGSAQLGAANEVSPRTLTA